MRAKSMVRGMRPVILATLAMAGALAAGQAAAVPPAEIYKRAQQEKPALIDTMKALSLSEGDSTKYQKSTARSFLTLESPQKTENKAR
ncbi:MAG: hypothetical protein ACRYGJ_02045, partial [Janthinobacterium lividum]